MSKIYQTLSAFQKDYQYDLSDKKSFLGEGSYGIVVEAYDHENNKKVALKIGKDLMQEFAAAKTLSHRNIAKYEACYRIADSSIGERDYAIMQLYADGNLSQLLEKVKEGKKQLIEKQLKELVKGILEGLQYLHQNKRIHRDFKPSNILISTLPNGNYRPLIADFGLTKVVGDNDYVEGSDVELSDGRGTASYKAPEQIEGENAHYNLDLWAFGVILYEIITGDRPFKRGDKGSEQSRMTVLFDQIKSVQIPEQINTIAEPYQAIIRRCLVKDIHDRVRKEDELLDLLNTNLQLSEDVIMSIPLSLEDEAKSFFNKGEWDLAMAKYAEILSKDNKNKVAQKGIKACMVEIEKLENGEDRTDEKFEEDEKESKVLPQIVNSSIPKVVETVVPGSNTNGKSFAKTPTTVNSTAPVNSSLWKTYQGIVLGFGIPLSIIIMLYVIGNSNKKYESTPYDAIDSTAAAVDTTYAVDSTMAVDTLLIP